MTASHGALRIFSLLTATNKFVNFACRLMALIFEAQIITLSNVFGKTISCSTAQCQLFFSIVGRADNAVLVYPWWVSDCLHIATGENRCGIRMCIQASVLDNKTGISSTSSNRRIALRTVSGEGWEKTMCYAPTMNRRLGCSCSVTPADNWFVISIEPAAFIVFFNWRRLMLWRMLQRSRIYPTTRPFITFHMIVNAAT